MAKSTAILFDVHFMTFYLLFLLDRVFVTVLDGVFLTLFAGDLLGHFDRDIDAVFLGNVHAVLLGDLFLHVITFLALYLVTLLPWNLLWVLFEKKSCQFTYHYPSFSEILFSILVFEQNFFEL